MNKPIIIPPPFRFKCSKCSHIREGISPYKCSHKFGDYRIIKETEDVIEEPKPVHNYPDSPLALDKEKE